MKRHFSSRGEALPEVTAVRGLAKRKPATRAAFMRQGDRQAASPRWFSQPMDIAGSRKTKQKPEDLDFTNWRGTSFSFERERYL